MHPVLPFVNNLEWFKKLRSDHFMNIVSVQRRHFSESILEVMSPLKGRVDSKQTFSQERFNEKYFYGTEVYKLVHCLRIEFPSSLNGMVENITSCLDRTIGNEVLIEL